MRSLLQFLGVWGAWIAFSVGSFATAIWAMSLDDNPRDERAASSFLWAMFLPLIWIYLWLTGKSATAVSHRNARSSAFAAMSEAGNREQSAQRFRTIREAKEYLASAIAKEAERDGTPLTEVERKMLYFTETGWTLPDMKEVSSEFDRVYDQGKYEEKIASIIARIDARLTGECEQERTTWNRALEKLSTGDHYLSILANASSPHRKGAKHNLKILLIALVFLALGVLDFWFRKWLRSQ